jgi:hypothetical protein
MSTPADPRSESELLIDVLLGLRVDRVREFMDQVGLPRSGTKADLRGRAEAGLLDGTFSINNLVDFLDQVEPWGRQHVLLLDAEPSAATGWRQEAAIRRRLTEAGVETLLERRRRERLPEALTLSSIAVDGDLVDVMAVERREYDERAPELDERVPVFPESVGTDDGQPVSQLITYKAYKHVVTRGLITLRWNVATRAAALHISEGFGRYDYDDALTRFGIVVSGFLDIGRFAHKDLGKAIRTLHAAERAGSGEVRSHRVGYGTRGGRTVEATSPSTNISVVGEQVVDDALEDVAGVSTGRIGNFFWLPGVGPRPGQNPLTERRGLHVVLIAAAGRVHFMVPSNEESVTHVLQRIRALS